MYAQQQNGIWQELTGNVLFSPFVYQTAESLTDAQRDEFKVYLIVDAIPEQPTREQKLGEAVCVINGTTLERTWPIVQKTEDEIASDNAHQAASIRGKRNQKIASCDWTQLPDANVNAQAWATYRQALRDIPAQSGFPWDIIWPNDPNYVES